MQTEGKVIDRIAYYLWNFFSYLFFAIGVWMILTLLLNAEYWPGEEYSRMNAPKMWEVLWEIFRALVFAPAPFLLLAVLFRHFASKAKYCLYHGEGNRFAADK